MHVPTCILNLLWIKREYFEFFHLDENLSDGDKRGTELRGEQAADKEVTQTSSEELRSRISSLT